MITIEQKGEFRKSFEFLNKVTKGWYAERILGKYGRYGVRALAEATPKDSGKTAEMWSFDISSSPQGVEITWYNSNVHNGFPIALMIQYGHGTGTGGYVPGIDYINPVMRPIFDKIGEEIWREVNT